MDPRFRHHVAGICRPFDRVPADGDDDFEGGSAG